MVACYTIPTAASLFLVGGLGFWLGHSNQNPIQDQPVNQVPNSHQGQVSSQPAAINPAVSLEPAGNWQDENHVHGLAVNPVDPQTIFVATHKGLR